METIARTSLNKFWRIAIVILLILMSYSTAVAAAVEPEDAPSSSNTSDDRRAFAPDPFNEYFDSVEAVPLDSNGDGKNDSVRINYTVYTTGLTASVEVILDVFNSSGGLVASYSDTFIIHRGNYIRYYRTFDYYAKYTDYFNFSMRLYDAKNNNKENGGLNREIPKIWLSPYREAYEIYVKASLFDRDSDGFRDDVRITVTDLYNLRVPDVAVHIDGSLKGYTEANGTLASMDYSRGYHEVDVFYHKLHAITDFKSEGDGIPVALYVDCDPYDRNGTGEKNDVLIMVTREYALPVGGAQIYIDDDLIGTSRPDGSLRVYNFDEGFHYVNVRVRNQWATSVFYAEAVRPIDDLEEFIDYAQARGGSFDSGFIGDDIEVMFKIGLGNGEQSNVTVNATLMYLNYTEIETTSISFIVKADEFKPHNIYFYNLSKDNYRVSIKLYDDAWKLEDVWLMDNVPVTHVKMIVNIDRGVTDLDNIGYQNDVFYSPHILGDTYSSGYIEIYWNSNGTMFKNLSMDESGFTSATNLLIGEYRWSAYDDSHKFLEKGHFIIYSMGVERTQTQETLHDYDLDGYWDDFRVYAYDEDGDEVDTVYVWVWDENDQVYDEGYTSITTPGGSGSFVSENIPEGNYTYETLTTSNPQRLLANGSFYSYGNSTEADTYLKVTATPTDLDYEGMDNDVIVKVVDLNNDPVPNARVYFDKNMDYYETTDSNGEVEAYDFEYGWHDVDVYSILSSPKGHAYTQFFSEGYNYDEYFDFIKARQFDADDEGDINDLEIRMDVDVDEWVEVEVTVVAYLYYQDTGAFYGKASNSFYIFAWYYEDEHLYFYNLPLNTTFNATYRLFDDKGRLEDEEFQYDIHMRVISPEVNVECSYYANGYYYYENDELKGIPFLGFWAHREDFGVKNVTISVYKDSDDSLVYEFKTDEYGWAGDLMDEDFEYTKYYWRAENETGDMVEQDGWFRAHQNITWDELLYDMDGDGFFDDFVFFNVWTILTVEDGYVRWDYDYINTTVEVFDANMKLIMTNYTRDYYLVFFYNFTEGDYYFRMLYKDTVYEFGEFYSYGNNFTNLPPSVEISSPANNSEYKDSDMIVFDGTKSSDPDELDRLSFEWRSDLDGFLSSESMFSSKLSGGDHKITLEVDDAHGHINSTWINVKVEAIATPNLAPRAVISSPKENDKYNKNDLIYFDGANSTDEVPANLTFEWKSDRDGPFGGNNSKFLKNLTAGAHRISLKVTDSAGLNSTDIVNITVENRRPVANLSSPKDGAIYNASDNILFDSAGSIDPDGDKLEFLWESNRTGKIGEEASFSAKLSGGVHMINLTASDGALNHTVSVTITVVNTPPVANITAPEEGRIYFKGPMFFDGSASVDLDGDPLFFYWELDDEPVMSNVSSFTRNVTELGLHKVELFVFDGIINLSMVVNFTIENRAPVADAGANISVNINEDVVFNASNSYDPDGDEITYIWDFDASDGIDDKNAEVPVVTYSYSLPGDFEVTLTVNDGSAENSTSRDNLTVHVNRLPNADAGPDIIRKRGQLIYFNGSDSSDPDDDDLTYAWDFGNGDTGTGMNVSYTYDTTGIYTVTLNVSDGIGWDLDTMKVTIIEPNKPPNAVAGVDKKITVNLNEFVTFNGSLSSDPDGDPLLFFWDFDHIDGTDDEDAVGKEVKHRFTIAGNYIVTLTVEDGHGGVDTDSINVTVNSPPTARIADIDDSYIGEEITFDGTGSTDPENHLLTYSWNFGEGIPNKTTSKVDVVFLIPGKYTVTLTVKDTYGATDTTDIDFEILELPIPVITRPSSGSTVNGEVDIQGTASGRTVSKVEVSLVYPDGTTNKIGTVDVTNGFWQLSWDSTSVTNDDYHLEARATDESGVYRSETSIQIKITIDNEESVDEEEPAPQDNVTEAEASWDILGLGATGCAVLVIVVIIVVIALIAMAARRPSPRRKRAPEASLAAARMDAFKPIEEGAGEGAEVSIEAEPEEEKGFKRPVKCPSCGEIFMQRDTGERPWMLWCTQCGARGLIKEDKRPKLPPGKDEEEIRKEAERKREKVKCPECTEIFTVWSTEKEIECPNCGITGEK
ncbi:MAG: PKD domain-containing protein [Thermoplasmata archaeon]|nr:MAG: PKD domain-containing protein [Thermoplasmata archaeon]